MEQPPSPPPARRFRTRHAADGAAVAGGFDGGDRGPTAALSSTAAPNAGPEAAANVPPPMRPLSAIEVFVIGAVAGATAKTLTAPMDRVRLLYQVNPSAIWSARGALGLANDLLMQAGAEGLYRGHSATLMRIVPFAGFQFLAFDVAKARLAPLLVESHGTLRPLEGATLCAMASGAIAGSAATLSTYPLDVLRTRLVAQMSTSVYRGYFSVAEAILRTEGPAAFYRGLGPTLLGVLPYSALSFGTFEVLKGVLREQYGDHRVPILRYVVAGGLSGGFAQMLVYPLHIVRRRMQAGSLREQLFAALDKDGSGDLCRSEVEPLARRLGMSLDDVFRRMDADRSGRVNFQEFCQYSSTRDALRQIRAGEGVFGGLFKGASLTWIKGSFTVGFAFVINDQLQAWVRQRVEEGDQFSPLPGQQGQSTGSSSRSEGARAAHEAPRLKAIDSLFCGGVAGAMAKTVIAPGDRVKIIFQTDPVRQFTLRNAFAMGRRIVLEEGSRSLWRGHGATLLRVVPYSATSFAAFEPYKGVVRWYFPSMGDVGVRFVAGAAAGATATAATYPLDVLRARMAVQGRTSEAYSSGYLRACRHITATEGVGALWSGARVTLLGIVPYSGLSFCMFETFKARWLALKRDGGLRTHERLVAGALSGLLAQSATYPLDVVRRRVQVDPANRNELQVVRNILRNEGIQGLYKGVALNWLKGPLAISVSFLVNDALRERAARWRSYQ
eukprot:CAMPEP_0176048418 /NCGR_PEP_ID=MMETSP0120_2-20121206/24052_1 /TAXON_ID=160619 /ORGANISM="Kryptoperidinium foliaceum, Strain CCMP 1326" /LENGTH=725 /DNA_ID=CAMNT_0017381837 /DNA_START=115 /DNA_END=2292 /DNA_ORIENTATION=-